MNNKITRRTFIKAIGLSTFSLFAITSVGCKEKGKTSLSFSELIDYDLISYNDADTEKVLYVITDGYGKYYALDLNKKQIDHYVIYDINEDLNKNPKIDVIDNFKKALNINYISPALCSIQENIGTKKEYSVEELEENLSIINKKQNKQNKKLIK